MLHQATIKKILSNIKVMPNECWEWTGAKSRGYAKMRHRGECARVHRVSYAVHNNVELAQHSIVMHKCDNPGCVNPHHLVLGTQADNLKDMLDKGRHWEGKLSKQDIADIRLKYVRGKTTHLSIAKEYGISREYIGDIIRGKRK